MLLFVCRLRGRVVGVSETFEGRFLGLKVDVRMGMVFVLGKEFFFNGISNIYCLRGYGEEEFGFGK